MKLTHADVIESRLTFNSFKSHNPDCDILELAISKDAFITYCLELKTGNESMEYYSGSNYVFNSRQKSSSRHYQFNQIPKKYLSVWHSLKECYKNKYANA